VPDFTGNFFFMTLGNLQLNPRAGVLFIDFETGDLLSLTGTAEVLWQGDDVQAFDGAERAWRFRVDAGWRLRDALPLRWALRDPAPHSLITGTWDEAARRQQTQRLAQTWRPYRVARIVDESSVIRSFHLEPDDGHGVPPFQAGQHLPIRLTLADGRVLNRTYTVSHAPDDGSLRLSIQREGAASRHLHDHVGIGDLIEALGPRGRFTIDAQARHAAVLIGAGVGITPMVAFARHLVAAGFRYGRMRPTQLIQVARNDAVLAFAAELDALMQRAQGGLGLHRVLSAGGAGAIASRLDVDLLQVLLPDWDASDETEFFLCGPAGFMQSLYDGLRGLGVNDRRIQAEAFGPASLKRRPDGPAVPATPAPTPAQQATVVFQRSGKVATWTPASGSLLELAEAQGLSPPFSCRAGHCGSCVTRLVAGRVTYAEATAWRPAEGELLPCCAVPARDGGENLLLGL
jgi:ferredoxin-NADP reductase